MVVNILESYVKSTDEETSLPGYKTAVMDNITVEELNIQINRGSQVVNNINLSSVTSSQILNLRSDKYKLVVPLPITLSIENDTCIVTSYDLNLFGYGESEDEAIQDLCEALVEYYEELEDNKNRLDKIPASDKHFLDQMIQKCN